MNVYFDIEFNSLQDELSDLEILKSNEFNIA